MSINLRPARVTESDCRLIMAWRNDATTLSMSFNQEPKQWDDFWQEYQREYFSGPAPVFAQCDGEDCGFLRFRPLEPGSCDISINIAQEHRGKSLAVPILNAAPLLLRKEGVDRIIAEVKLENAVSQHIFLKAGYQLIGEFHKEGIPDLRILRFLKEI